jgi:hypothetical protein
MMSGAFNACCFVVVAAMTATRLMPTASASSVFPPEGSSSSIGAVDDNERQKTSSPFVEDVPLSMFKSEPSTELVEDDDDVFKLSGDVERRRANFRGDLGKRSQRAFSGGVRNQLEMATARRGMRTANSRLRPDLGKRSPLSAGGARLLIDSRTSGMRRRFRPDLGKRAIDDEDAYSLWPAYSGPEDQLQSDDDLVTSEANLWNDYAYRQAADGDEEQELSKRGRSSSSSFRGDLGKRRSPSSFRGDLGKRRRRSTDDDQPAQWQPSSAAVSRLLHGDGGDSIDEEDIDGLVKRARANAKSAFRGDLGKRRSSFRGDLGKRNQPDADSAEGSNEDDIIDDPLSSHPDAIEKRPRSSSSFRGDLGKRDAPKAAGGAGRRSLSSLFAKRPRPQSFRGDLGKRSAAVDATESAANGIDGDGKSAAAAAHE